MPKCHTDPTVCLENICEKQCLMGSEMDSSSSPNVGFDDAIPTDIVSTYIVSTSTSPLHRRRPHVLRRQGPYRSALFTLTLLYCGTFVCLAHWRVWCVYVSCVSALGESASCRKPPPEARDRWSSGAQVLPGDRATCTTAPPCDVGNVVCRFFTYTVVV